MAITFEQFRGHLAESTLFEPTEISAFLEQSQASDVETFARWLVKHKHLTLFQAQQLYAGKGKSLVLGNYVILDKLGQGGMGMVLKARHRRMKRLVALKMLSPAVTKTPTALKRFQREVEAAAKLRHPNIVAADDADEARGTHFLVLEYVAGSDLSVLVKEQGVLPVDKALACLLQAARGLAYAHQQGVVHRDIKPANLLLDQTGTVKILDMGLARLDSSGGDQDQLTGTGQVMGTVDFMAPEQAVDTKQAGPPADIYSLGITLWYLLTGRVAYAGDTIVQKLMAHQNSPIPSLSGNCPGVTPELDAVFRKMISKRPDDRYQSMADVVAALEALAPQTGSVTWGGQLSAGSAPSNDLSWIAPPGAGPTVVQSIVAQSGAAVAAVASDSPTVMVQSAQHETGADLFQVTSPSQQTTFRNGPPQTPWWKTTTGLWGAGAAACLLLFGGPFLFLTTKNVTETKGATETQSVVLQATPAEAERNDRTVAKVSPAKAAPALATPVPPKVTLTDLPAANRPSLLAGVQPILVEPGQPLGPRALVSQPASLPGLRSWSVELAGTNTECYSLLYHPSGEWFVTLEATGNIKVWNSDGTLKRIVQGQNNNPYNARGCCWLDDGRLLATTGWRGDTHLSIWDTETWACLRKIPHLNAVCCWAVAWSPVLQQLAIGCDTGIVLVDPRSEQTGKLLLNQPYSVMTLDFTPDGNTLIATQAGTQGLQHESRLLWFDLATQTITHTQALNGTNGQPTRLLDVAVSPDGKFVAGTGWDGVVYLWDAVTAQPHGKIPGNGGNAAVVEWFRDSRRLAVSYNSTDWSIKQWHTAVWDIEQPDQPLVAIVDYAGAWSMALTPDGQDVLFGSQVDQKIYAMSVKTGEKRQIAQNTTGRLSLNSYRTFHQWLAPSGDRFADQRPDEVILWDSTSGIPQQRIPNLPLATDLAWSPTGKQFITWSRTPAPWRIVDTSSGAISELPASTAAIKSVAWSPDGEQFASAGDDQIAIWDRSTASLLRRLPLDSAKTLTVAWSPDGNRLAAIGQDNVIRIWNPTTAMLETSRGNLPEPIAFSRGPQLAWLPDSQRLWVAMLFHCLQWDTETGELIPHEWLSSGNSISGIATSPAGRDLLVADHVGACLLRGETKEALRSAGWRGAGGDSGLIPAWHADNRRCLWVNGTYPQAYGYDTQTFQPLGTLYTRLTDNTWITVGPEGHYRGGLLPAADQPLGDGTTPAELAAIEKHLVYVTQHKDGSRGLYTPAEFAQKFGWKNDPQRARLLRLDP